MFLFIYFLLSETSRSNNPFVVLHDYVVLRDLNFPVTKLAKWLRYSQYRLKEVA